MAHTTHIFVRCAEAARACGKPQPYINGLWDRNYGKVRKHGAIIACDVETVGGKQRKLVCIECVTDFYGKAGEDESLNTDYLTATPLIGFRGWKIFDSGRRLQSDGGGGGSTADMLWDPNGVEAKCTKAGRISPCPEADYSSGRSRSRSYGGGCGGCGIYCVTNFTEAYDRDVRGAVAIWGGYVQGYSGYRGRYAKPVAFLCDRWYVADEIHRLGAIYRVQVVHSVRALKEVAKNESGEDPQDWGSSSLAEAEAAERTHPGRGSCRIAADSAFRADSIQQFRRLADSGMISPSNLTEFVSI